MTDEACPLNKLPCFIWAPQLFCWDSIRTRGGGSGSRSILPAAERWMLLLLPLITFPMIGRDLIDFG
jgi:hypothetical protein